MNDKLQDILMPEEEVVWRGKPKVFCYVLSRLGMLLPITLAFLFIDIFLIKILLDAAAAVDVEFMKSLFSIVIVCFCLLPLWLCIGKTIVALLEYRNIDYAATSRRIIARSGIYGLDFKNADYSDVSSVQVNVSVIERFLRVGTIVVSANSGQVFCLRAIPEPYSVHAKLNQFLVDMKSDMRYPNAYRPSSNPGYNTKYVDKTHTPESTSLVIDSEEAVR